MNPFNPMSPIILMEEISKRIITAFKDINELCRAASASMVQLPIIHTQPPKDIIMPKSAKDTPKPSPKQVANSPGKKEMQSTQSIQSKPAKQAAEPVVDNNKEKKKRKTAQKVKKDPLLPKKPLGPFLLYQADRKQEMEQKNPHLRLAQISKIVGKEWQSLNIETKANYRKKFQQAKLKYEKEMKQYMKTHPNYEKPSRKKKAPAKTKEITQKKQKKSEKQESIESSQSHQGSQNEPIQVSSSVEKSQQDSLGQFM